jgi:alcohol dehydrogenase
MVHINPHEAQALLLHAPRDLRWVTGAPPELDPHDVLMQIRTGAISLGTDLPLYLGCSRGVPAAYPLMTGYETIGEVEACGAAVQTVAQGNRVVCFIGHRTAAVLPETRVIPIPPDIPDALAVLVILACDTAKGVSKVTVQLAITGAGAIGLLTLFNLHARGMHNCLVIEPDAGRRVLAMQFGAQATYDPADAQVEAEQCLVGFECSSRDAAFGLLQELLEPDGQLCVLADGNLEPLTLTPAFHAKELTIVGSSDGLDYHTYAACFWDAVRSGRYPLTAMFKQTVDAVQLAEAFAELAASATRPVKVLVQYAPEAPPDLR